LTGGLYDGPVVPSVVELLISETVRYLKLQRIAEDRTKRDWIRELFLADQNMLRLFNDCMISRSSAACFIRCVSLQGDMGRSTMVP